MPTIEALREWMLGNTSGGGDLPSREKWDGKQEETAEEETAEDGQAIGGKISIEKMKKKRHPKDATMKDRRAKISVDGDDAILGFGKFKGSCISDIVKSSDGRSYVRWMIKQEFPSDLIEIAKRQLRKFHGIAE